MYDERLEVTTERVVPTVSVPAPGRTSGDPGEAGDPGQEAILEVAANREGAEFELPWPGLRHLSPRVGVAAGAAAVSFGIWLTFGDVRVAVMCGLVALLVGAAWTVDRWTLFSFGQGFVGYRPDLGWPQGVQEDDDVHWDWRTHGVADEGTPGPG